LTQEGEVLQTTPRVGLQQNGYQDVLTDGARRFMCPDTLH
jgi:hypothetical protein